MEMEKAREKNMVRVQQKEIDLMDLFKILYKNRIMIAVVTITVTLASLGGALYIRSNTNNITAINFKNADKLDKFYIDKANLGVAEVDIENLFKQDDVVEKMYKLQLLNELFLESGADDTINERRRFIEDTIKLKSVVEDKKLKYYQVSMEQLDEKQDEKNVINTYLNILNDKLYTAYSSEIDEKYQGIKQKKEGYEEALGKINAEVNDVISKEPKELFANDKALEILQLKYPRLFERQREVKELYVKYGNELVGIEGIKGDTDLNKQLEKVSSFYEIKQKSKAKLILAVGVVMGVILGMMMAFMKEFWSHFKEEIN